MARLTPMNHGRVKVSWYDCVQEMSRSRVCKDQVQADAFKALVETEDGDTYPSMWLLQEKGLPNLADKITPIPLYVIKELLMRTSESAEKRLLMVSEYLAEF